MRMESLNSKIDYENNRFLQRLSISLIRKINAVSENDTKFKDSLLACIYTELQINISNFPDNELATFIDSMSYSSWVQTNESLAIENNQAVQFILKAIRYYTKGEISEKQFQNRIKNLLKNI
jgi:hypothetical protein